MNRPINGRPEARDRRREIRYRVRELRQEQRTAYRDAVVERARSLTTILQRRLALSPAARRYALWVGAGLVAATVAVAAADLALTGQTIHRGVVVAGRPVGGLTVDEADKMLREGFREALRKPAVIRYQDRRWRVKAAELDLAPDTRRSAQAAYAVGRRGGLLWRAWERTISWLVPLRVHVVATFDRPAVRREVQVIATDIDRTPQDAWVKISGTHVEVTPAGDGRRVDQRAAARSLLAALLSLGARTTALPVVTHKVDVTEDGAMPAYRTAQLLISRPVKMMYRARRWRMSREEIGRYVEFYKTGHPNEEGTSPSVLAARIAAKPFESFLRHRFRGLTLPPKDAAFAVSGKKVRVVPSREGRRIDERQAYARFWKAVRSKKERAVLLKMKAIVPSRTTAEARAMGVREMVSTFTTYYDSDKTARVNNIQLVAAAIDKSLIAPGAQFSLNRRVGPRTAEKGYQEAPQIENGELVPALGGGACQVATTLFNAIFFGGYPVVERQPHTLYISHYPDGRDAAVSWPDPDLRFRNDTKAYILVRAWADSDSLSFSFYSTNYHRTVEYRTGEFTDFTPPNTKYVPDPTLYVGDEKQVEAGYAGRSIHVTRVVRQKGNLVRKDEFYSTYQPKPRIVRRGTKPRPQPKPKPSPRHETKTGSRSTETTSN